MTRPDEPVSDATLTEQLALSRRATANRELIARQAREEAAETADRFRELAAEHDALRREHEHLQRHNDELQAALDAVRLELHLTQHRLGIRVADRVARALRRSPTLWRVTSGTVRVVTRR